MEGFPKCPVCDLARAPKRVARLGRRCGMDTQRAVEVFVAEGCEAIGGRHFGDSRMDRFADGVGAVAFTEYATMDLMQERRDRRYGRR